MRTLLFLPPQKKSRTTKAFISKNKFLIQKKTPQGGRHLPTRHENLQKIPQDEGTYQLAMKIYDESDRIEEMREDLKDARDPERMVVKLVMKVNMMMMIEKMQIIMSISFVRFCDVLLHTVKIV